MDQPAPQFILRDKVERFIAELYVELRRYPKSERHVLAAETRQAGYRLLRNVITAGKLKAKEKALNAADVEIQLIHALLRIAMELEYLQFSKYEKLIRLNDECGRILGGWKKNL